QPRVSDFDYGTEDGFRACRHCFGYRHLFTLLLALLSCSLAINNQLERNGWLEFRMRRLNKIVSGGQTGVDQAALRAAKASGLSVGGWCPPGRVCEAGVIPSEFPLQETERERSPSAPDVPRSQRTEWNVRDSDATLVLVSSGASHSEAATEEAATKAQLDPGTAWAMRCARRYGKPLLLCDLGEANARDKILRWLE